MTAEAPTSDDVDLGSVDFTGIVEDNRTLLDLDTKILEIIVQLEERFRMLLNIRVTIKTDVGILSFGKHNSKWCFMVNDVPTGSTPRQVREALVVDGWIRKLLVDTQPQLKAMMERKVKTIEMGKDLLFALDEIVKVMP